MWRRQWLPSPLFPGPNLCRLSQPCCSLRRLVPTPSLSGSEDLSSSDSARGLCQIKSGLAVVFHFGKLNFGFVPELQFWPLPLTFSVLPWCLCGLQLPGNDSLLQDVCAENELSTCYCRLCYVPAALFGYPLLWLT